MSTVENDPTHLRSVAEIVAREAAAFVRRRRSEIFGTESGDGDDTAVQTKTTPTDPVTIVDTETERLLRERLAQLRSGDSVLGEEGGGPTGGIGGDAVTWVVDPIDGTVNFVYGIPAYAVSVAAQVNGESVAGAVADVVGDRLYSAAIGLGAQVVDAEGPRALRCSAVDDLSLALVGTGFAYSQQRRTVQAELASKMLPSVRDVRRIGSAALDLCMVAAGRLDAYYEHGLKVWDYAAGALIAAEAGARVVLPEPTDPNRNSCVTIAAAPGIADQFLARLKEFDGLAPIAG